MTLLHVFHPAGTGPPSFGGADVTTDGYTQMMLSDMHAELTFSCQEQCAIRNIQSFFPFNGSELTFLTSNVCFGTRFMARKESGIHTSMQVCGGLGFTCGGVMYDCIRKRTYSDF